MSDAESDPDSDSERESRREAHFRAHVAALGDNVDALKDEMLRILCAVDRAADELYGDGNGRIALLSLESALGY